MSRIHFTNNFNYPNREYRPRDRSISGNNCWKVALLDWEGLYARHR